MKKILYPLISLYLFLSLLFVIGCEDAGPEDCSGKENGNAVLDSCGVCDNDPTNDCQEDCASVWGGDNICGCTDVSASNFDSDATFDDGSCDYIVTLWGQEYSVQNTTELILNSRGLTGVIPSEIGELINLETLWLHNNELTGSIPSAIWNLTKLRELRLNSNQLTGSISSSVGNLTALRVLSLSNNDLSGSLPSAIYTLSGTLRELFLNNNQLTGEIVGTLPGLTYLWLQYNQFSGVLPEGVCGSWTQIYAGNNQFCAPYPSCMLDFDIDSQNTSNCN
tara:strand:+ start:290 stop:1126 length:837 start_codon:yes stop_codon:yes gene_type:complete